MTIAKRTIGRHVRKWLGPYVRNSQQEFAARFHLVDEHYQTVKLEWLLNSIKTDPILAPGGLDAYKADVFDCDDFAFFLKHKSSLSVRADTNLALALGCIITVRHAFNLLFDPEHGICLLDVVNRTVCRDKTDFPTFLKYHGRSNRIELIYM